jgi:hypothetical protein
MAGEHLFKDIVVQPLYGKGRCLVKWVTDSSLDAADFFVYSSTSGTPGSWTLLNEEPVVGAKEFADDVLSIESKLVPTYYRLLAEHAGQEYDSPVVGTFDILNKNEYRIAHRVVHVEYANMVRGNGIRMFHCKPLRRGAPCPSYDPETEQKFSSCPNPATDCYGTPFVGGFLPPLQTWVRFMDPDPVKKLDEGGDVSESRESSVRCLAFPEPMPGDMFVQVGTDNRYVVDQTYQPFVWKGSVTIAHNVKFILLDRNDPRYRLTMPVWQNDPARL